MNEGRVVATSGLNVPVEEYEQHFQERHMRQSTACTASRSRSGGAIWSARSRGSTCASTNCRRPPNRSRELRHRLAFAEQFPQHCRAGVEMIDAYEEAIAIVQDYNTEPAQSRVPYEPKPGTGCHATEAPRGLLYHRYRIGDDGLIAEAKIVPPTSQNQGQIEEDLRAYVPQILGLDDAKATLRCEHLIRNYDPCISCATHFLRLQVERPPR